MKHILLLSILLLVSSLSFSQVGNFDLSKYKLPDIKRHQMDFYFYTDGNSNSTTKQRNEDTGEDAYESKSRDYEGNADVNYKYYRNSELFQSSINSYVKAQGTWKDRFVTNSYDEQVAFFNSHLGFGYNLNMFNRKNKWFFKTAPAFNLSYIVDKETESKNIAKTNTFNVNSSLKLGFGIGRIEQVQDFRHAVLIVKDLEERNVLTRNISESEIVELATFISELKNKRFFDYRKQKEAELTAIHSFFTEKELVSENSISYFNGLNDMWAYGAGEIRESGNQFLFAVTPGYSHFKENYSTNRNDLVQNRLFITTSLSQVWKKPISIKWQRDFSVGAIQSFGKTDKTNNNYRKGNDYYSRIYTKGNLNFYPNTRTGFGISISPEFGSINSSKIIDNKNFFFNLYLSTSAHYYISERLRVGYGIIFSHNALHIFNDQVANLSHNHFHYRFSFDYAIF